MKPTQELMDSLERSIIVALSSGGSISITAGPIELGHIGVEGDRAGEPLVWVDCHLPGRSGPA